MSRPTRTERMILTRIHAAIKIGKKVAVDGVSIKAARFQNGEIEVEWDVDSEPDDELRWTVIQPDYLHEFDNGELDLRTY